MVLTGSCPWPGSWFRSYGAHLHLQAREDPYSNGDGGPAHLYFLPRAGALRKRPPFCLIPRMPPHLLVVGG